MHKYIQTCIQKLVLDCTINKTLLPEVVTFQWWVRLRAHISVVHPPVCPACCIMKFTVTTVLYILANNTHTHTQPFNGPFPGLPGRAGTRKVKPIWILVKQETVSGNGISWAICKSAPCSRQITVPAPHHSVFYRPDALPAAQPTASKHWRHILANK